MTSRFVALLLVATAPHLKAQSAFAQDARLFGTNAVFGALTAGVGAVINRPDGEKWHRSLLRGAWQGAVGGTLTWSGKALTRQITVQRNLVWGWPSNLVHAAGTSIIYSAALNRPFLRDWYFQIGIFRAGLLTSREKPFQVRAMPWAIVSIFVASAYGSPDWRSTALTGQIAFRAKRLSAIHPLAGGVSFDHTYVVIDHPEFYQISAHEINHIYQFREYFVLNAWLNPIAEKARKKWNRVGTAGRYVYLDVPWDKPFYELSNQLRPPGINCHYNNWFEFEAEKLSVPTAVETCP